MKIKLCFLIICFYTTNAFAAGTETGTTIKFWYGQYGSGPTSAGYTFFSIEDSQKVGSPSCATALSGERWVIDNDWPPANMQLSTLFNALAMGKQITVRGTGDCGAWPNTETARDILIAD